ncbi:thioredoxin family protein [Sansalvadorimonas sp. 2012CJ34-2]|uniref:Thioredoxin family protein n=1 Tax=Parendozoicomonas callyspongiae TaxID=2942213 RepID=A0ABT0PFM6_9GAMM|nr:thioredoxin family protein [Sansalvadorimonas sp. 2012CJ34-2]MCL6270066.1 thioredoxin family protein [Sansalvadorimonas sp. 2012CJ34-2]
MLLDTPICDFGWKAPDLTLKDPDGNSFTMTECMGDKGLLIMFICNHCPYVQAIKERLAEDAAALMKEGFGVLAIMSNDYQNYPLDAPEHMKEFARQNNFSFPYLIDEDQSVAKAYDAVCTPDFFGFNSQGELQYRGRIDDAKMGNAAGRTPELLNAMRMVAKTGKGPAEQKPSMGCSIKWR